jgi:hypothetical protein
MTLILFLFVILFLVFLITVAFIYITRPWFLLVTFVSKGEFITDVDMWKAFIVGLLFGILMVCVTVMLIERGYDFSDGDCDFFNRCFCKSDNIKANANTNKNSNTSSGSTSNTPSDSTSNILYDKETNENKIVTHPIMKVNDEMGMM